MRMLLFPVVVFDPVLFEAKVSSDDVELSIMVLTTERWYSEDHNDK